MFIIYAFMILEVNNLGLAQLVQVIFALHGVIWAHLCICSQLTDWLEDAGL